VAEKEEALEEEAEFWAKELETRNEGISQLKSKVQVTRKLFFFLIAMSRPPRPV
jgi:hypothetical protein